MKRLLTTCLLSVMLIPNAWAKFSCPDPRTISRVSGEFAWESDDGRFEGYFASPRIGRGQSSSISRFSQARFIQLTNTNDSKGIVECDYIGNYGDEIIRFSLAGNNAVDKPTDLTWSCRFNPTFPGVQCTCSGDAATCAF